MMNLERPHHDGALGAARRLAAHRACTRRGGRHSSALSALALTVLLVPLGCSDDDAVPGDAAVSDAGVPDTGPESIEVALEALGVDLARTPRVGADGDPLPADYGPLGSRPFVFKVDELLTAGLGLTGHSDSVNLFDGVPETRDGAGEIVTPFRFDPVALPASSWDSVGDPRILERNAIGADIDGDGRDELVVLLQRTIDDRIYVIVQDDGAGDFAVTEPALVSEDAFPGLTHIELATGDVDADGSHEIAVVLTQDESSGAGGTTLWMLNPSATGHELSMIEAWTRHVAPVETGAIVSASMAAGNLDDDNQDELALVVNEVFGSGSDATAHLFVFDSGASGAAVIDVGAVDVEVDTGPARLLIADSTVGDIDRDGRRELIVGGLINVNTNCDNPPDMAVGAFHLVEGALQPAIPLGATVPASIGPCESAGPLAVRAAFVNALDVDGDGDDEIAANQAVVDYDPEGGAWSELGRIRSASFLPGGTSSFTLDRGNTEVVVGDVTGDRRGNVVYVTENAPAVEVWGAIVDPAGVITYGSVASIPVDTSMGDAVLVPINVDRDSYSLSYSPSDYELIFTEPILVAALAAAPCHATDQNTDACVTSFGEGVVEGTAEELSFTVTASVIIGLSSGVDVPFVKVEAETEHKISVAIGYTYDHAYSVERSVTYATGPLEDTVIFTTVPYDRYVYTILDHPDDTMVGKIMAHFVPRDPVTLQVERSFYNAHVVEGGVEVGSVIFAHTVGDPSSYPSAAERDEALSRHGGLATAAQSVGQGAGSVEVGLDVSEEWAHTGSLALGYEFSAKATAATFIAGYSVGVEVGGSLQWSSGTSTSYHGTVGNLSAETFAARQYSFGLFTYKATAPSGREFEVLNYWVQ